MAAREATPAQGGILEYRSLTLKTIATGHPTGFSGRGGATPYPFAAAVHRLITPSSEISTCQAV